MAETKKKTAKAATEEKAAKPAKKASKKKEAEPAPEVKEEPAKKAKKAKKEVVAEPVKPTVTEAKCKALNIRVTPRKIRLVADLVRGKDVDEALDILKNLNRSGSAPVYKAIQSAAANATNNFGLDGDKLYVSEIQASDGLRMKRYIPRAKGSASSLVKRTCNLYVTVKERK